MASRSDTPSRFDIVRHRKFIAGPGLRGQLLGIFDVAAITLIRVNSLAAMQRRGTGPHCFWDEENNGYLYPAEGLMDWLNELDYIRDRSRRG
jgi:hypothetical protein